MNRCRPERKDTKERGKCVKRILKLEKGGVPDRKLGDGKLREKREESQGRRSR